MLAAPQAFSLRMAIILASPPPLRLTVGGRRGLEVLCHFLEGRDLNGMNEKTVGREQNGIGAIFRRDLVFPLLSGGLSCQQ